MRNNQKSEQEIDDRAQLPSREPVGIGIPIEEEEEEKEEEHLPISSTSTDDVFSTVSSITTVHTHIPKRDATTIAPSVSVFVQSTPVNEDRTDLEPHANAGEPEIVPQETALQTTGSGMPNVFVNARPLTLQEMEQQDRLEAHRVHDEQEERKEEQRIMDVKGRRIRRRRRLIWAAICCCSLIFILAVTAIVVAIHPSQNGKEETQESNNAIIGGDSQTTRAPTTHPSFAPTTQMPTIEPTIRNNPWVVTRGTSESELEEKVYVVNKNENDFCGHERRANNCGGHLASITNSTEMAMIRELVQQTTITSTSLTPAVVWLGGIESDMTEGDWGWIDGSFPFYTEWAPNQPDNSGLLSSVLRQHHMLLNSNGYMEDERGCNVLSLSRFAPGVYILPLDYLDTTKYPECFFAF